MLNQEISILKAIAEDLLELSSGTIDKGSRKPENVVARIGVCNVLLEAGLTPAIIARYVNKDRSNIYHYQKEHAKYLSDKRINPFYNEFWADLTKVYNPERLPRLWRMAELNRVKTNITNLQAQKEILLTQL